jgi:tetratricopeptide (TPR) repeat protein
VRNYSVDIARLISEGVALCREGNWNQGIERLSTAADQKSSGDVSSLMYSYLGYGIAKFKGKRREGLTLCEHAVKVEFYQPDNQLNLARTLLLNGNRKRALEALKRGLQIDPDHRALVALRSEMGSRKSPVLGFLGRDNFLNVFLGRLRHSLSGSRKS